MLIGLAWPVAVVFALVWLAVAAATRYSSAAALAASLAVGRGDGLPCARTGVVASLAVMVAILWWTHRENIRRLLAGEESRIGKRS